MLPDLNMLALGLRCKCPRCREGDIYSGLFSLEVKEKCASCGLDLSKNDSADGPAVFLIFLLGFALVPLALIIDYIFHWPMIVHVIVWSMMALGITIGLLKPLKAYIIALQFKHRKSDWS